MKSITLLVFTFTLFGVASAQIPEGEVLEKLYWNSTGPDKKPLGIDVPSYTTATVENQSQINPSANELKISTSASGLSMGLLELKRPSLLNSDGSEKIVTHHYAITGEVRYENTAPGGYLEMWSYFASPAPGYPEGSYFSRTLADGGPMGKIEGTSGWRAFWLQFDSSGTTTKLESLVVNLHLTGPGTVHLRNMKLMQYPDAPNPALVHVPAAPVSTPARTILVIAGNADATALTYSLDGTSYPDLGTVEDALKTRHASNPETELVIRADERTPYEVLQSAVQMGANAGIPKVSVEAVRSPATAAASSPAAKPQTLVLGKIVDDEQARALKTIWFCLGIATTALTLLVITSLIFLSRFWQRRHHERELRRIASLDS